MLSTKVGRLLKPVEAAAATGIRSGTSPFEIAFDYSYDGTLRSLENSLQRLRHQRDRHRADPRREPPLAGRSGRAALCAKRWKARIARYRICATQGTIKAFGVGVNDWSILQRFAADGDFDCFMLAGRYTLLDHTALDTFMPDCERRGISVLMAAPFNSGILATGRAAGRDVLLRRGRRGDHGAHAADRDRLRAPRRRARRCGAAVSVGASGGRKRRHRHAQRDRSADKHRALPRGDSARVLVGAQARRPDRSAGARCR